MYQVGDVVLVEIKIGQVFKDAAGTTTYAPESPLAWFTDDLIKDIVSDSDLEFNEGDYVTSTEYPELGVGVVAINDHTSVPYCVQWPDGEVHWQYAYDLLRAEKPEV